MNETQLLQELNTDLFASPAKKVLYLEGKTDTPIFFALLGRDEPLGGLHQGVLVRGLHDKSGTGKRSVRDRVELAQKRGYSGIWGIVDGDGEALSQLSATFDMPFAGPLFRWKAYSIENLLVKTGWPIPWGVAPDWTQVFLQYAPYIGLNHVHRILKGHLETLRIAQFSRPKPFEPLLTVADVEQALTRDRDLIYGYDVADVFNKKVAEFETLVRTSLDEAHALINGKWLTDAFAPHHCQRGVDACRQQWITHAISAGGILEVRTLWHRLTGKVP